MSKTLQLSVDHTSGKTVYAVAWLDGTYWDTVAQAFTTGSGSWADAVLATTEHALESNAKSNYEMSAALTLADLWNGLAFKQHVIRFYEQAGGSADLTNDLLIHQRGVNIACGFDSPELDIVMVPGHRKDLVPKEATFQVALTADGEVIDGSALDDGPFACSVEVHLGGDAALLFTGTVAGEDALGRWFINHPSPAYVADRTYLANVKIGASFSRMKSFYGAG